MKRFRSLALAACAPLLLLAGCSDGSPTGVAPLPAPEAAALSQGSAALDVSQLARFTQRPVITIAWAKKWIGPEGGRLEFQGFVIDVPPGAVDKVTQFSIHLPVDPQGSEHVVARFGPHGATFAEKVTIELPYAGTSVFGQPGTVVWGNPSTGAWEDYGGTLTDDGKRLSTETSHFSTYGVMGGGVLVSGG
jgi:hypothetical protein